MALLLTFMALRDRVMARTRDSVATKDGTFGALEYEDAICDAYVALQARLPDIKALATSDLTLTAGSIGPFTLSTIEAQWTGGASGSGGKMYSGDVRIRNRSDGRFLTRLTTEEMDAIRAGAATPPRGVPEYFSLWLERGEALNLFCWPAPTTAAVCDVFATLEADDLRSFVGAGSADLDTVSIQLSRRAAQALVYYASAEAVATMPPEELAKRKLNPTVGQLWMEQYNRLLYGEIVRRHQLHDAGRTQRWVS